MTFDDLYAKPEKSQGQDLIALHKRIQSIGDAARQCIATDCFVQYKTQFEKAQSSILDAMISYTNQFCLQPNGDIAVYALKIARYIQKIQDLKLLLGQVEIDANKGLLPEPMGEQNG